MSCSLADNVLLPGNIVEPFRKSKEVSSDDKLVEPGWVMR